AVSTNNRIEVKGTCETGIPVVLSGTGLGATVEGMCANSAFTVSAALSPGNGDKTFQAIQTDQAGNKTAVARTVRNNSVAPSVIITQPAFNFSTKGDIGLKGTCRTGVPVGLSGSGVAQPAQLPCAGGAFAATLVLPGGDGAKSITVTQTDETGMGTDTRAFVKDTLAPELTLTEPAGDSVTASSIALQGGCETGLPVMIWGQGLVATSSVNCSGSVFTASAALTAGDGTKEVRVSQTDSAGNYTTITRMFTRTTPTPPPVAMPSNGALLYSMKCASCHRPLDESLKRGRSAAQITAAIGSIGSMSGLKTLSAEQVAAIANALTLPQQGSATPAPITCADTDNQPPPIRVWKLTNLQYENTVKDLFGTNVSQQFERDSTGSGFKGSAKDSYVSPVLAEQYEAAARSLAQTLSGNLATLLPCTPADPANEACVAAFISAFGKKAFRQPTTAYQRTTYLNLYRLGKVTSGLDGVQMVIEAMLQSPSFIYRLELGAEGASGPVVTLTAHEIANQLSYLLWNAPPDAQLLAAADANALSSAADIRAQADRMLADAKAREMVADFFAQLFELDGLNAVSKDAATYPSFTADLKNDLIQETRTFVKHVVFDGTGRLDELFTADYSFMNSRLAALYGVAGVTGGALQKVALPPGQRSVHLTQ
ncbi:MAG: DUF1592 domain-containing protein, partial [Bdellovibrionia bacterium]